jgi:hypothetical protein
MSARHAVERTFSVQQLRQVGKADMEETDMEETDMEETNVPQ